MGLRTGKEYREDLKKGERTIYAFGERIKGDWTSHPLIKPVIDSMCLSFDMANDPNYQDMMTKISPLIGERISRYTQIHETPEDYRGRLLTNRELMFRHGACVASRCAGSHALNAVYSITYEMDEKLGTNYHKRFVDFLKEVQKKDLAISGCVTDVKGDRSKAPKEQSDPDMYVRVVEKRSDGIVIRGAKAHQSTAFAADYHLVCPTAIMRKGEEEYAVVCAVDASSKGVIHIMEWPTPNFKRLYPDLDIDMGNPAHGIHGSSLIIFDDVFVPNEHVFMCGEGEFTLELLLQFSRHQRLAAAICKTAAAELMAGAAAVIAEYNGLNWKKVAHIRDKIADIIREASLVRGCAVGAALLGKKAKSGVLLPDILCANAAKLGEIDCVILGARHALDIAGGIVATIPSERDLKNPETKKYIEKYLKAKDDVSVEDRMRMIRFIEYITGQASSLLATAIHTGGSPEVQNLIIRMSMDIESLAKYAKKLAGIKDEG